VSAKLLENVVLQELVTYAGSLRMITTYKKNNKSRNEVDFIVRHNNMTIPVEVKLADKPSLKPVNQLLEFMNDMNAKKGFVIYTGKPHVENTGDKEIKFIPPYLIPEIFKIG